MAKLLLFDFQCPAGHVFEDLVEAEQKTRKCACGARAKRIISGTRLDPKLGVSTDYPTMADKWERKQRQRAKIDNIDGPNLWMY